jgi:hypothetical protein
VSGVQEATSACHGSQALTPPPSRHPGTLCAAPQALRPAPAAWLCAGCSFPPGMPSPHHLEKPHPCQVPDEGRGGSDMSFPDCAKTRLEASTLSKTQHSPAPVIEEASVACSIGRETEALKHGVACPNSPRGQWQGWDNRPALSPIHAWPWPSSPPLRRGLTPWLHDQASFHA